ncbi:hypothetical protein AB3Y40_14480 [Yoonia sp. R2331]|uniref:hypothetical protein n=1 Tax=Yoonia sp. R2331 TaxID=3237238 RepID=UPI0034E422BC
MAEQDIWQRLQQLTKGQLRALRSFLFPPQKTPKKSIKPKDQDPLDQKDPD